MSESYEVDSEGDLLIILSIPEEPFAFWNDLEGRESTLFRDTAAVENPDTFDILNDKSTLDDIEDSSRHVQFKVSSKHLMMASRRFKTMLTGNWAEANTIYPSGYRRVELEGFDREGTKIVLNILHGKTRRVPRVVDLELLAKIAVLVDDLECYEEAELFSDMWIGELTATVPTEYGRDLVLWILISSVFRKPDLFKSTTRTAILRCPGPIQTLGLPISQRIEEELNRRREDLVDGIITALYGLVDQLRTSDMCIFECQSILLGALVKHMGPLNLLDPRPPKPFSGFSFAQIAQAARHFRTPVWYSDPLQALSEESEVEDWPGKVRPGSRKKKLGKEYREKEYKEKEYQKHRCSLQNYLQPEADRLYKGVHGLSLDGE